MKNAQLAAIVQDDSVVGATTRLLEIVRFLGIPFHVFDNMSQVLEAGLNGSLSEMRASVIGPLPVIAETLFNKQRDFPESLLQTTHSFFAYLSAEDTDRSSKLLQNFTGDGDLTLSAIGADKVPVKVSKTWPDLTGPMHGIRTIATARSSNRVLRTGESNRICRIIDIEAGSVFFSVQRKTLNLFVSCSSDLPDLTQPLRRPWYDIKDQFLSAVPILMYLKWAFRDVCWQANEAGACLIIDDPVLRSKYGFCDFRELDALMQEHSFTTNIAVIPWNWRRTSPEMAALIGNSKGRFSISVHGCDHTDAEFGSTSLPTLNSRTGLAKFRMERHKARTGISHDLIMVFPQGVFSKESLGVLQQHQYLAAVNTDPLPVDLEQEPLTIGEMWNMAILRHRGFPFFVRRYPTHGLENFAFDLLLGKPCLIVEHHAFFKGNGQYAIDFVQALNSLNCTLKWRGLGDVLKRSYQWRVGPDGMTYIKMFANELLLSNESNDERFYQIEKADRGSTGVTQVSVNGDSIGWRRNNDSIVFDCEVPPLAKASIRVQYRQAKPVTEENSNARVKIALRRYLSEFRDDFLSRHERLLQLAQKTKGFLAGH